MGEATISKAIIVPSRMVFFMWLIYTGEKYVNFDLGIFGIYPRTWFGLIGVITGPLIHGNLMHLASNTFPLLFLGTTLYFFYSRIAGKVFIQCYLGTGVLVWIFGRESFHIGASGVIYALAGFLVFFGLFRKDLKSIFISIVILSVYWTLVYGIFPGQYGISWESHLFGALVGGATAFVYSKFSKVS
ncbi:MAG TPA: rhomboid family intramembrane serine protease [Cyclobacteriaceae bacterium]|jgi:membrane associated rhomboid family serine protease